jgi:hypothetical protein
MTVKISAVAFRRLCTVVVVAGLASSAHAVNLVTDPGFEFNPLTTAANSLGNFPGFQGVWGQELSTIVGVDGGISPASGAQQLRMDLTGGVTTQAFQTIDVSAYAGLIDSGAGIVNAGALYNARVPGALAGVYVSYFTGNTYGTLFGPLTANTATLDANPLSWEPINVSDNIPALTRWMLIQVAYSEASLTQTGALGSGYVDDVYLEIVPTPGAAGVLAMGGLMAARRRRA